MISAIHTWILLLLGLVCLPIQADSAQVYVIRIRSEIGNGLRVYIKHGIEEAEAANADAIIFDIDTPGGAVNAAKNIIDDIHQTAVPTIAYVNNEAISAGAMISLACDQIVMRSGGTIGDSAPVSLQGKEAGEKIVSYVRGKIEATAERQGRNPHIAKAMVDKKLWLVELENGDIVSLRSDEYEKKRKAEEIVEVIASGGEGEAELLTLTTDGAIKYQLAEAVAESLDDLLDLYLVAEVDGVRQAITRDKFEATNRDSETVSLKNATQQVVELTLADRMVIFLTSPIIAGLLLSLGTAGLFIEIRSPGFGVPGLLGLLCLSLFFGGHMLSHIEAQYALMAFVFGVCLLLLEAFVIPGFGIAGILGLGCIAFSIFFIFSQAYETGQAITTLSISVLVTVGLCIVAVNLLPKTRTWHNFVLQTEMASESGFHSAAREDFQQYLGQVGTALTTLRPSGTIRIGENRIDAVSVGDFINSEATIKVVQVEGAKIYVEEILT